MDETDVIDEALVIPTHWDKVIREMSLQWKHRLQVQFSLEHGQVFAYLEFHYLGYFPGRLEARKNGSKTDINVVVNVTGDKMREYLDIQGRMSDDLYRKEWTKLEKKVMEWLPMIVEDLKLQPMEE